METEGGGRERGERGKEKEKWGGRKGRERGRKEGEKEKTGGRREKSGREKGESDTLYFPLETVSNNY